MSAPDYNRDVRHYEFDIAGKGWNYGTGDCLGVWAENTQETV
jgi:sulfite reductase alpha subunit-like flavoprotein